MSAPSGNPSDSVSTRWIGRLIGESQPLTASGTFVLAGIDWQAPHHARIELRARKLGGGWTAWVLASVLGHDSDGGETAAYALVGEPVWTGRAGAVQVRSNVPVEGLRVHLVSVRPTARAAAAAGAFPLAEPDLPAGPGQPAIIARRAWAGDLEPRFPPAYGDVRLAFVHHSVTANGYSSGEVPAILRSIYYFHTRVRGWNDIGYNFAVDAYGRIWEARAGGIDQAVVGAQAGGYNLESFGAVLLGDFESTLPTSTARGALAHLVAWKLALHGVPIRGHVTVEVDPSDAFYTRFRPGQLVSLPRIAGHRDGCTTDCPGDDMYFNGMPPLRHAVAQLTGRQVRLTLEVGPPPRSEYSVAPYAIAPGTVVQPAHYLQLASVRVRAGDVLPLHGYLRSFAGNPLRTAPVMLQEVSSNITNTHEASVAKAVTHPNGLWVALLSPRTNLLLRALHAEAPAAASALLAIGVAPVLELTLSSEGRTEVAVTGKVTPPKRDVVLEAMDARGKQGIVLRKTVDAAAGRFRGTLRLKPGRYWITARTQADASNLAGASPRLAAHV
jgi:N-acetylmuramoyl-L-alanine amidase-like protein